MVLTGVFNTGLGNSLLLPIVQDVCKSPDGNHWHPFSETGHQGAGRWKDLWSFALYWSGPCAQEEARRRLRPYVGSGAPTAQAVLHWRCSDVPFIRHPDYELPALSVAGHVRKLLARRGFDRLLVLTKQSYKGRPEARHCAAILEAYLEAIGVPYTYHDGGSEEADLQVLHGAALVVALINSSFSFAAKLHDLKNYRVVYTNPGAPASGDLPWQLPVPTLPHARFANYSDLASVLAVIRASAAP